MVHRVGYFFLCFLLISAVSKKLTAQKGYNKSIIKQGIRVDFSLTHVNNENAEKFIEGENVRFRFKVSDTVSEKPLSNVSLAAWMDKEIADKNVECGKKIKSYIEGGFLSRPELDLNVYYVLTLNGDNSINVVNPLFGFGGSQLYTQIQLPAPGYDWAIKEDQSLVFVSMPEANQVAFIGTDEMKILSNINIPGSPRKLVLQADEHYLWVSYDVPGKPDTESGIVVIDVEKRAVTKLITTGKGAHEIVVNEYNKMVYVSNQNSGSVSVVDMKKLENTHSIKIDGEPLSMAWSAKAQALYVVNKTNPVISVIDGQTNKITRQINSTAGSSKIYFAPGGRNGFVINPKNNTVHIIDASSNKIVQTADVEAQPDEISFTENIAFVRHLGTEIISMIPLKGIGREGVPVSVAEFSSGQNPPAAESPECGASGIIQAPGNAVLVSNYKDKSVYYYQEGMAASMGSFNTYGKNPKAVMIVNRSIREKTPGEYETVAKLGSPGIYDLALFINVPLIMECFQINVLTDSVKEKQRAAKLLGPLSINYISANTRPQPGETVTYKFQVIDLDTKKPVPGLKDIHVMDVLTTQNKHDLRVAKETEIRGTYEASVKFDSEGLYYLYIECPSRGLSYNNTQFLVLYASKTEETK